jgi:hypothetical protein
VIFQQVVHASASEAGTVDLLMNTDDDDLSLISETRLIDAISAPNFWLSEAFGRHGSEVHDAPSAGGATRS